MRVIDTNTGDVVDALLFTPDRARLVVGTEDRGVAVYDPAGGDPVPLVAGPAWVAARFGLSADRDHVYLITQKGRVGFDPTTGAPRTTGPSDRAAPGLVRGFAGSADGGRLVTAHFDYPTTRLVGWTAAAAGGWSRAWLVVQGDSAPPELTPAGDRLVQIGSLTPGDWNYQLLLRDPADGALLATGEYPYSMLRRPRFRPDGRQVVAAHEMTLLVWDTRMPAKPALVRNDSRKHFTAAAYHPSGRHLFTTSNDATVTVWDTDSWARVKRFDWDIGRLRAVAVSPDGLLAAAGSDRGRVVVWDVDL